MSQVAQMADRLCSDTAQSTEEAAANQASISCCSQVYERITTKSCYSHLSIQNAQPNAPGDFYSSQERILQVNESQQQENNLHPIYNDATYTSITTNVPDPNITIIKTQLEDQPSEGTTRQEEAPEYSTIIYADTSLYNEQHVANSYANVNNERSVTKRMRNLLASTIVLATVGLFGVALIGATGVIYIQHKLGDSSQPSATQQQHAAQAFDAFGIMRTQLELHISDRLVEFDSVIRSVNSINLDLDRSSFTVSPTSASPSLYWMIVGVEVPIHTQAKVRVSNTSLIISKTHSNNSDKDIITNSGPVQLEHGKQVIIRSDNPVLTAYWSGFCLNIMMQSLVVFFVACSKQLAMAGTNIDAFTKITYDTVVINEGQAWNALNNSFVAPSSGVYIFSVNVGFTSPHNPVVLLGIISKGHRQDIVVSQAGMGRIISSNSDFVSTSRVLHLKQGDIVEGQFARALSIYSDSTTLATSLSAFLYSPVSNVQIVWSVSRAMYGWMSQLENPLAYEHVRLNQGGAWSPSQNAVVIATPGIYYVFVALDTCDNSRAALWLKVNGEKILEIKSTQSEIFGQTRSNGAVIRLAAGDRLTVEDAKLAKTCLFGDDYGVNSFFGLLLSPASASV